MPSRLIVERDKVSSSQKYFSLYFFVTLKLPLKRINIVFRERAVKRSRTNNLWLTITKWGRSLWNLQLKTRSTDISIDSAPSWSIVEPYESSMICAEPRGWPDPFQGRLWCTEKPREWSKSFQVLTFNDAWLSQLSPMSFLVWFNFISFEACQPIHVLPTSLHKYYE